MNTYFMFVQILSLYLQIAGMPDFLELLWQCLTSPRLSLPSLPVFHSDLSYDCFTSSGNLAVILSWQLKNAFIFSRRQRLDVILHQSFFTQREIRCIFLILKISGNMTRKCFVYTLLLVGLFSSHCVSIFMISIIHKQHANT